MNKFASSKVRLGMVLPAAMTLFVLTGQTALAVPPPDFIFNLGGQIVQVFAIVVLFVSAGASMFFSFLKAKLKTVKKHVFITVAALIVAVVGLSYGVSHFYGEYQQRAAYDQWLVENQTYAGLDMERPEDAPNGEDRTSISVLDMGADTAKAAQAAEEDTSFISYIDSGLENDPQVLFVEDYYRAIAEHEFEKAYALSKKSVDEPTFAGWYKDVNKITLDKFTKIDDQSCSLELTLYEGDLLTQYATALKLENVDGEPVRIASSKVKVLGEVKIVSVPASDEVAAGEESATYDMNKAVITNIPVDYGYFEAHANDPLSISNQDFQNLITSGEANYIVLDAREDLEYSNGNFPGSIHIRYADLQAGRWIELPEDKTVYVFCWSGIRGKEVAKFLREKKIVARYLEGGASAWVDFGGAWEGNIDFKQTYSEDRYKKLYTTDEVKRLVGEGVVLVDTREPWRYQKSHVPGSVNIPIMYTPTVNLEEVFGRVPAGSTAVTVCDDYVNCFDAKITGVELEHRGHTFIGRYNKPWEYK